ncbi:PAN domain-containing protein [uncultured Sphingorhabdus sp.]|uniref:PAN domain-containing protein n=1 Tax=uncultured Sphingorhabdus sp. TaxID=1686106 RepID=UPI002625A4F3|nr:PAN domain-containing protein [uncultured Sphingorhabdus sp.]HMS20982.1 PAN domain-containing protein [Sphingorhabdus sp.]
MRKSLGLGLMAVALAGVPALAWQDQQIITVQQGQLAPYIPPPTDQVVTTASATAAETGGEPITNEQRKDLYGGVYDRTRPGVYMIRAKNSDLCVEQVVTPTMSMEESFLRMRPCNAAISYQHFAILPGQWGNSIRPAALDYRNNQFYSCTQVAEGVLFGPPRIDMWICSSEGLERQGDDQLKIHQQQRHFKIVNRPDGAYTTIQTMDFENCWDIRGGSVAMDADIIRWACHAGPGQQFQLDWVRPLAQNDEKAHLLKYGWDWGPDGHRRFVKARGVELPGGNYADFETINDDGAYCSRRCLETATCKGWTWTGDGFTRPGQSVAGPPKCYLKSTVGSPISWGARNFYRAVSGIVR